VSFRIPQCIFLVVVQLHQSPVDVGRRALEMDDSSSVTIGERQLTSDMTPR
jgi:hypothetical protein